MGKVAMIAWCAFAALMAIVVVFMVLDEVKTAEERTELVDDWANVVNRMRNEAYAKRDADAVEFFDSVLDDLQNQMEMEDEKSANVHKDAKKPR
jgi:hypothetical protein